MGKKIYKKNDLRITERIRTGEKIVTAHGPLDAVSWCNKEVIRLANVGITAMTIIDGDWCYIQKQQAKAIA